jgi:hypothetical protein
MARARQIRLEPALGELAVAQELGLVPRAYEDAR